MKQMSTRVVRERGGHRKRSDRSRLTRLTMARRLSMESVSPDARGILSTPRALVGEVARLGSKSMVSTLRETKKLEALLAQHAETARRALPWRLSDATRARARC